jgi:hypothetical protein
MKSVVWVLLGIVIGVLAGWYARALGDREVQALHEFRFTDRLADQQAPYVSASGSWRGANLANKINTVYVLCDAREMTCDMSQADVMALAGPPYLSLDNTLYRITNLDAQRVIAEPSLPSLCIHQTLTFDRVAKAVTMVRTKINHENACSFVQNEPLTLFLGEPPR